MERGQNGNHRAGHNGGNVVSRWTLEDIPSQNGRSAIVTGANTGIGYETARALARAGGNVILACRSSTRGQMAVERLASEGPPGRAEFALLDLADLDSVRAFAESYARSHDRLDLLINNAGVMIPPASKTKQGFELQFGVNHLGHFALTGHLLRLLLTTPSSRIVTVSSGAHRQGKMTFEDLQFARRRYRAWAAYSQSKLANLLFTFELQRKLTAAQADLLAVAAHPGWAATDLQRHSRVIRAVIKYVAMSPQQGALPTLRAATAPDVKGGEYYGPDGFREAWGYPVRVGATREARSLEDAARLWAVSEELTGVRFDL